ncbi:hypothetical protein PG993_006442 [Apiospora rasikravindrae]|uniref:Uncharacterized protein n=1 Tax=Apiospora rasikravindrae TaxID=990691 RepID=A0ABR1T5Q9_9PEZI
MKVPRILPAALGVSAILGTAATLFMNIANADTDRRTPSVRIAASVASALEGLIFLSLIPLFYKTLRQSWAADCRRPSRLGLALRLILIKSATVASIAVLVILGKDSDKTNILGGPETSFLTGGSVVLAFTFAAQLVYVVVHHVNGNLRDEESNSMRSAEGGSLSLSKRVKAVPYSQTVPRAAVTKERLSAEFQSPPGSSGGKSSAETMSSIRSSFSQAVRPISSKTRLLSSASRTGRRPPSLDSLAYQSSIAEEGNGFDSWDTSAVDAQDRQTVMDTSPPPPRFLETIPASPTTSRSPSPGTPLELELEPPKPAARRSRSYSPMARRQPTLTTHASTSELHIHPLFRTDSPEPPRATPGTSIHAAEDAGKVISESKLDRMRSGSMVSARSPLSRTNSRESIQKSLAPSLASIASSLNPSTERLEAPPADSERKMTPPLPEWILNAGSRTSLTEYEVRKHRDRETTDETNGLGITQ